MTVSFAEAAGEQFRAALAYIRRDNPAAAARLRQRVRQTMRRLEEFPESGRVVPEYPDLAYREVIVAPYRFFYRVIDQNVLIVAVWHGAQLPTAPEEYREL